MCCLVVPTEISESIKVPKDCNLLQPLRHDLLGLGSQARKQVPSRIRRNSESLSDHGVRVPAASLFNIPLVRQNRPGLQVIGRIDTRRSSTGASSKG